MAGNARCLRQVETRCSRMRYAAARSIASANALSDSLGVCSRFAAMSSARREAAVFLDRLGNAWEETRPPVCTERTGKDRETELNRRTQQRYLSILLRSGSIWSLGWPFSFLALRTPVVAHMTVDGCVPAPLSVTRTRINSSGATGLAKYVSKPAPRIRRRSSSEVKAVSATIGTLLVGPPSARI